MRKSGKSPVDYELRDLLCRYRALCDAGLPPRLPVTRWTRLRRWIDRRLDHFRYGAGVREDDRLLDRIGMDP